MSVKEQKYIVIAFRLKKQCACQYTIENKISRFEQTFIADEYKYRDNYNRR